MTEYKGLLVNLISSWYPRVCGIGSFSQDTVSAIASYEDTIKQIKIHPIDKTGLRYLYPIKEKHVIRQLDTSSWENAANVITERAHRRWVEDGFKSVVVLEHEYGLDGNGRDNNYNLVAKMLKQEKVHTIVVLHTIKRNPNEHEKEVVQELGENCNTLVVLSPSGIDILRDVYGVENAIYITHGIPNRDKNISKEDRKRKFGLENRVILGTPGLLSRGKGLEYGIEAFSNFLDMIEPNFRKNLVYIIAGQTHPEVLNECSGRDFYREEIWKLCEEKDLNPIEIRNEYINGDKKLNLEDNKVIFVNTHFGDNALADFISAEDVGILPYRNPEQISSGITFYHAGIGTPCVSTSTLCATDLFSSKEGEPFYIEDLIKNKDEKFQKEISGVLTDFDNPEQIARGIKYTFENSQKIESNILKKGHSMVWQPVVGSEYVYLFTDLISDKKINICQIPFIK